MAKQQKSHTLSKEYLRIAKETARQYEKAAIGLMQDANASVWWTLWKKSDYSNRFWLDSFMQTGALSLGDLLPQIISDNSLYQTLNKKITPWLQQHILLWRIPFYPTLGIVLYVCLHLLHVHLDYLPNLPILVDILPAELFYWSVSPTMMAIGFWCVDKSTTLSTWHKRLCRLFFILCSHSVSWLVARSLFFKWQLGDYVDFVFFLLILGYIAFVGSVVTAFVKIFLKRISIK